MQLASVLIPALTICSLMTLPSSSTVLIFYSTERGVTDGEPVLTMLDGHHCMPHKSAQSSSLGLVGVRGVRGTG